MSAATEKTESGSYRRFWRTSVCPLVGGVKSEFPKASIIVQLETNLRENWDTWGVPWAASIAPDLGCTRVSA